jgi:hypothetical protein
LKGDEAIMKQTKLTRALNALWTIESQQRQKKQEMSEELKAARAKVKELCKEEETGQMSLIGDDEGLGVKE